MSPRFVLWGLGVYAVLSVAVSCSGDVATPLQRAYPRAALYDTVYVKAEGFPVRFDVNARVDLRRDSVRQGWFDIVYPGYFGASVVNCTLLEASGDALHDAIDNRIERMSLNAGGLHGEAVTLRSDGGWRCELIVTPSSRVIPVQFLAENGRYLLTGTYNIPADAGTFDPDSAAPYIDAVSHDMIRLLKSLE